MKVCVITSVLDAYKGGNHLPLMAACFDTEFTIVCNRSKVSSKDLPVNVTVVIVPGRMGPYYYGVLDFFFARVVMRTYPPDSLFWKQFSVIHINQMMGPALRCLRHTGVPFLFFIHHPVTADRMIAMKETNGVARILWYFKYFLLVQWQKRMCEVADRIVTVSRTMHDRIAKDYSCEQSKIFVVPNGVNGHLFKQAVDADCDTDVIAIGSFVHPRKGFRYLADVYMALAANGIRIADVGRRTNEQVDILKGIPGVMVYGTVEEEVLIRLVQRSRVLVSTSLFEGFGLSLIEALSCGRPAFAFAVGAVPEILGTIDPSLIIPERDVHQMVRAIERYIALSSAERDANSMRYQKEILLQYSLEASANALQLVYEELSS
ncbi:hypothetical protein COU75_00190 [Candidatus Peregrinibacteria bacterium CG10_big_fil_rev_8_21_14_0_10_42_8]|nr:MAG: hypothetical protein COU75_00190 [Candidatus Peregrinibacteria bacterium CG10_big_fil_rev_8_21_14_0_10_42_8]